MGEESSSSTTIPKKIPTVAKVQDMINKKIASKTETSYKYIISNLTLDVTGYSWGVQYDNNNYAIWSINEEHEIYFDILQKTTDLPVIELRYNQTKPLHSFTVYIDRDGDFKEQSFTYNGSKIYSAIVYIDLSEFVWCNEALEDGEYSIYAYQDGIAYKTAAVSLIKKTDSIIKPNTNELITFGVFRDLVYPISSVYVSSNNINPGNFIGGTWVNKTGIISAGFAWVRTA